MRPRHEKVRNAGNEDVKGADRDVSAVGLILLVKSYVSAEGRRQIDGLVGLAGDSNGLAVDHQINDIRGTRSRRAVRAAGCPCSRHQKIRTDRVSGDRQIEFCDRRLGATLIAHPDRRGVEDIRGKKTRNIGVEKRCLETAAAGRKWSCIHERDLAEPGDGPINDCRLSAESVRQRLAGNQRAEQKKCEK